MGLDICIMPDGINDPEDYDEGAWDRDEIVYVAHSSYGHFNVWREILAMGAGYEVLPVIYGKGWNWQVLIDWGHITRAQLEGVWYESPDDPLLYIIAHYDYTGHLSPDACARLHERITEIVETIDWNEHIRDRFVKVEPLKWGKCFTYEDDYDLEQTKDRMVSYTEDFLKGLELAVEKRQGLYFI